MEDTVLKYLAGHWPVLTFIVCLLLLVIVLTIKATKVVVEWTRKVDTLETKNRETEGQIRSLSDKGSVFENKFHLIGERVKVMEGKIADDLDKIDNSVSSLTDTVHTLNSSVNLL